MLKNIHLIIVIVVLWCFTVSIMFAQSRNFNYGLNMIVENNVEVKQNQRYLNVIFFNNTEDTILLPLRDYIVFKEAFSFEFVGLKPEIAPSCGLVKKQVNGEFTNRIYDCHDFVAIPILPFQFKVYRYSLEYCDPFVMGVRYEYQVRFNLELEGQIRCSPLWRGLLYSNLGSFTMVK